MGLTGILRRLLDEKCSCTATNGRWWQSNLCPWRPNTKSVFTSTNNIKPADWTRDITFPHRPSNSTYWKGIGPHIIPLRIQVTSGMQLEPEHVLSATEDLSNWLDEGLFLSSRFVCSTTWSRSIPQSIGPLSCIEQQCGREKSKISSILLLPVSSPFKQGNILAVGMHKEVCTSK